MPGRSRVVYKDMKFYAIVFGVSLAAVILKKYIPVVKDL